MIIVFPYDEPYPTVIRRLDMTRDQFIHEMAITCGCSQRDVIQTWCVKEFENIPRTTVKNLIGV